MAKRHSEILQSRVPTRPFFQWRGNLGPMNKSTRKSVVKPFLDMYHIHIGCQRRAFCKDLSCIGSKKSNLNKTLLCPHFPYPRRDCKHKLYIGDSWIICRTTTRCSEMIRMCQACKHHVGCFRQCVTGYTPTGGFQFSTQGLQINF